MPWTLFGAVVVGLLALDLFVVHRDDKEITLRDSLGWSAFWIALALVFAGVVWVWQGPDMAQQFVTGYLIEKSLSIDNLFVFVLIFAAFGIGRHLQHKVLFWGVFGAIVMRLVFIFGGIALLERFGWLVYVFGALLVVTAVKMWRGSSESMNVTGNPVVRLAERFLPIDCSIKSSGFSVVRDGKRVFTSLLLALLAIEAADLVFAVDSVPAVLAVSQDPFIVFTANVFAILGLRSLYFALAGCVERFAYLHYGLAVVLGFVGVKMLLADFWHVPTPVALGVIVTAIAASIGFSWYRTRGAACEVPS